MAPLFFRWMVGMTTLDVFNAQRDVVTAQVDSIHQAMLNQDDALMAQQLPDLKTAVSTLANIARSLRRQDINLTVLSLLNDFPPLPTLQPTIDNIKRTLKVGHGLRPMTLWFDASLGLNHRSLGLWVKNPHNLVVNWGDTHTETLNFSDGQLILHEYLYDAPYEIKLQGRVNNLQFKATGLVLSEWGSLLDIDQFVEMFASQVGIRITAPDSPVFKPGTSCKAMFYQASTFDSDIRHWYMGLVVDMTDMFHGAKQFTQDISHWNVSQVRFHERFADGSGLTMESLPVFHY